MKSIIIISVFSLTFLFFQCGSSIHNYKLGDFYNLEQFRNMMKTEMLQLSDSETKKYLNNVFKQKYVKPDSIGSDDPRIQYFYRNKYVPDYIKNALVTGKSTLLMTIGEFYLAHPELRDSTKIYNSFLAPEMLTIGFKGSSVGKHIVYGKIWEFRFGFLIAMGEH